MFIANTEILDFLSAAVTFSADYHGKNSKETLPTSISQTILSYTAIYVLTQHDMYMISPLVILPGGLTTLCLCLPLLPKYRSHPRSECYLCEHLQR